MDESIKYSEAIEELENIVNEIEDDRISLDELTNKLKRASSLIKICKKALFETEQEVKTILDEMNESSTEQESSEEN